MLYSPLIKGDKGGCVFSKANTTPCTPFSKGEFNSITAMRGSFEKAVVLVYYPNSF